MEKGVLGKSRKYTNGSIHENASGKFQILDRYLGEEEKPFLKYQWLTGDKEGQIEENKEENINASLYKFRVSRGIREPLEQRDEVVTLGQIYETIEDNNRILTMFEDNRSGLINELQRLGNKVDKQQETIEKLTDILNHNQKLIDTLIQRDEVVNKLNDVVTKLVDKIL